MVPYSKYKNHLYDNISIVLNCWQSYHILLCPKSSQAHTTEINNSNSRIQAAVLNINATPKAR